MVGVFIITFSTVMAIAGFGWALVEVLEIIRTERRVKKSVERTKAIVSSLPERAVRVQSGLGDIVGALEKQYGVPVEVLPETPESRAATAFPTNPYFKTAAGIYQSSGPSFWPSQHHQHTPPPAVQPGHGVKT